MPGRVRLRVIGAFLSDRKLTTAELQAELPDVPPTSLYRHLGHLIDAGVLDVVAERRVRGTVERTYVLGAAPPVSPEDSMAEASGRATLIDKEESSLSQDNREIPPRGVSPYMCPYKQQQL